MSVQNRALSRRWFDEVWNQRRTETIDELLSPDSIGHMESGDLPGVEPFKQLHGEFLAAFPDLKIEVEDVVSDGDDVVVRWRASGTHSGEGLGLDPSEQPIAIRGLTWHRYKDGQLVEGWDCWNQEALMQQLREGSNEHRERTAKLRQTISDRLREIRIELFGERGGAEMARRLGIPIRTMFRFETGVSIPVEVLLRVIDEFNVRPAWLLRGEEPRYEGGRPPAR